MNTTQMIIDSARNMVASMVGGMKSSALLCLSDAVELQAAGNEKTARIRAIKSLAYSVGIGHPAYVATTAKD